MSCKSEILSVFLCTPDDVYICDPEAEYYPLVKRLHGQGDVGKTVDVRMTPTGSFRKYNPSGTVWTARLSWAVYKLLGSPPGDVKLNPDWVEWLMGFPRRWTDIPCGPKSRRKSRT